MSLDLHAANVIITPRTLQIGRQTYQLRNIARVQIVNIAKPADEGKGNNFLARGGSIALFVVMTAVALAQQSGAIFMVGLIMAVGVWFLIYFNTRKRYPQLYALLLESTGHPQMAIASPDLSQIQLMERKIIEALDTPTEESFTINNITQNIPVSLGGQQMNQMGSNNQGIMG